MGAHLTSSQFMKNSKYIIFRTGGDETPVVFSPLIQHNELKVKGRLIVAAGFCELDEQGKYFVWGESSELKKAPDPRTRRS